MRTASSRRFGRAAALAAPIGAALLSACRAEPQMAAAEPRPIYCYRTLAEADCFVTPIDEGSRLIGWYGPPPPYAWLEQDRTSSNRAGP